MWPMLEHHNIMTYSYYTPRRPDYTHNVNMGTIQWKWCDDKVKSFTFFITSSYYTSDRKIRPLYPQQWVKHQNGHKNHGSVETTVSTSWNIFWDKREYYLHISLVKLDNVPTYYLTAIYNRFDPFCQEAELYYNE